MLGYILYRTTRYIRRLEAAHMEQERIGSELRIASRIQMEMLPARNTAYKERADLSVSCLLEPAKTVGGDPPRKPKERTPYKSSAVRILLVA